jgi:peptidylprolyl isomerase/FKBP-type peptidyl-prolyl cis-trans isomerase FklB
MKKQPLFVILLLSILLFSACDDKTETVDDRWKIENEAQFNTIANSSEYTKLNSISGNGFIMYKVLETGTGDRAPFFNEQVKVRYTGWYKNIWTKPDTFTDEKGNFITNKIIFDTTSKNNIARTFTVNGVVDGFSTALQHMKEGDKWEVWMPWILGYGPSTSGAIKGYSTLVFEIELVEIVNK